MKIVNIILDILAWLVVAAALAAWIYITYVLYMFVTIFTEIYWWEIAIIILIVAFVCWRFFRR